MTYRELQHTDSYKLFMGAFELLSVTFQFTYSVIKSLSKASFWLIKKTYLWVAKC